RTTCGCASTCSRRLACPNCTDTGPCVTARRICACSGWRRKCWARSRPARSIRSSGGSARSVRSGASAGRGSERPRLTHAQDRVDDTRHLVFEPLELLEKLVVLTRRPRINLVLYHSVLAPHRAWRARVVAYGATAKR